MTVDIYLAVEAAMTEEEKEAFLSCIDKLNPHMKGAKVADYLSILDDLDAALEFTESLPENWGNLLGDPELLRVSAIAVYYFYALKNGMTEGAKIKTLHLFDRVKKQQKQERTTTEVIYRNDFGDELRAIWDGNELALVWYDRADNGFMERGNGAYVPKQALDKLREFIADKK